MLHIPPREEKNIPVHAFIVYPHIDTEENRKYPKLPDFVIRADGEFEFEFAYSTFTIKDLTNLVECMKNGDDIRITYDFEDTPEISLAYPNLYIEDRGLNVNFIITDLFISEFEKIVETCIDIENSGEFEIFSGMYGRSIRDLYAINQREAKAKTAKKAEKAAQKAAEKIHNYIEESPKSRGRPKKETSPKEESPKPRGRPKKEISPKEESPKPRGRPKGSKNVVH